MIEIEWKPHTEKIGNLISLRFSKAVIVFDSFVAALKNSTKTTTTHISLSKGYANIKDSVII